MRWLAAQPGSFEDNYAVEQPEKGNCSDFYSENLCFLITKVRSQMHRSGDTPFSMR
jgi:hypothetical protein